MLPPPLLLEISPHQLEVTESLLQVGRFVVIFLVARAIAEAIAGKVAAGWSYLSKEPTNRLVVGLGIMPRGEVVLIFLCLGSQAGILTSALEAGILLMVIGTTFLAPILLRLVIPSEPAASEAAAQ
jgi:Kef-type K+ transport system membrane component KefB